MARSFEPALPRVFGSLEPVRARVGDSALLPCHCSPAVDLTPLTVEWSRTELRPHPNDRLKRVPFVHVYTDLRDDDPDMKIPGFVNRTELDLGRLSAGVASLRIRPVAPSDNGTYKCFIPNLHRGDRRNRWALVSLVVIHDSDTAATSPNATSDIEPRHNGSGRGARPTVRGGISKIAVFTILGVAVVVVTVLLSLPTPKKPEPLPRYGSPDPETTAPSAGGDADAARAEGATLLFPSDLKLFQVIDTADK